MNHRDKRGIVHIEDAFEKGRSSVFLLCERAGGIYIPTKELHPTHDIPTCVICAALDVQR